MNLHIVEKGKLVPYERFGECKQCGACCRKKITFDWTILKPSKPDVDETFEDWQDWENWSIIYARGIYWYILVDSIEDTDAPCGSLEGNLCSIHRDQFELPTLCPLWPVHPKDLLPNCGYSFERDEDELEAA